MKQNNISATTNVKIKWKISIRIENEIKGKIKIKDI